MSTNALSRAVVLALAAVGSVSATPLEARVYRGFEDMMLRATNWYRAQHGAEPLSWDESLADIATNHANACVQQHSGNGHGENMAFGGNWQNWVDLFGQERTIFDFDNGDVTPETGHFTQLVWKDTTRMGCGWASCGGQFVYHVVCNYESPGNVAGETRQNVGHQIQGSPNDQFPG